MKKTLLLLSILVILLPMIAAAQDDDDAEPTPELTPQVELTSEPDQAACPEIVEQALTITRVGCEGTGRNEICYGHQALDAQLRALVNSQFGTPGDIVNVINIQNLSLSAMDIASGVWGVVLMQLQPDLADQLNDDDITFVVFGDAALESVAQLVPVRALTNSNIRADPATTGTILTTLTEGDMVVASGRTEDAEWLRIRVTQSGETEIGWIFAELVTPEDDFTLDDLPVVTPDDLEEETFNFGPMSAFYFESGRDDAPCTAAPNSGLLIQTPEGAASVSIWIDEVIIELNGTAFVQAQANGDITINVLDQPATVTANGQSQSAVAGTAISVPLDANLGASGVPNPAVPIDPDDIQSLPITLLPETIDVAAPLDVPPGAPAPGAWQFAWAVESLTCPDGTVVPFESTGEPSALTLAANGSSFNWGGAQYTRTGTGVYTRSFFDAEGNIHQDVLTVNGLGSINGVKTIDFANIVCSLEVNFSLTLVGASGG